MGQIIKEAWKNDIWLKILTVITISLFIAGFLVPPAGVIDGSVLLAGGELSFFGVLFEIAKAIDKGQAVSVKHKDTEMSVTKRDNN